MKITFNQLCFCWVMFVLLCIGSFPCWAVSLKTRTSQDSVFAFLHRLYHKDSAISSSRRLHRFKFKENPTGKKSNSDYMNTDLESLGLSREQINHIQSKSKPFVNYSKDQNSSTVMPDKNFSLLNYTEINAPLNQANQLQDWLMISSTQFLIQSKFPPIPIQVKKFIGIDLDDKNFRINSVICNDRASAPPDKMYFWFRLNSFNIYYSSTKSDINVLDALEIGEVVTITEISDEIVGSKVASCFLMIHLDQNSWKLCSYQWPVIKKWQCKLKKILNIYDITCIPAKPQNQTHQRYKEEIYHQPVIIIPKPSPVCNENWNYQENGANWECQCKDGKEQSPIDLPSIDKVVDSPLKPEIQFDEISNKNAFNTIDGMLSEGQDLQIHFMYNSLRILHHKLGKAVSLDGGVFFAEEIIFRTPSEHTIEGRQFGMEMQVIFYGQTQGDIAKQISLSVLFDEQPGVYNQFIEDLDYNDLPSFSDKVKAIKRSLFIPKVFYDTEWNGMTILRPFSFYSYKGSLTFPPCSEDTDVLVASKPIPLSKTIVRLFHEAIRLPDVVTADGFIEVANQIPNNNRIVQNYNARQIFYFDHMKYCDIPEPVPDIKPSGHYEKIDKDSFQYLYVDGPKPSGIPGAFVVSSDEATDLTQQKINNL